MKYKEVIGILCVAFALTCWSKTILGKTKQCKDTTCKTTHTVQFDHTGKIISHIPQIEAGTKSMGLELKITLDETFMKPRVQSVLQSMVKTYNQLETMKSSAHNLNASGNNHFEDYLKEAKEDVCAAITYIFQTYGSIIDNQYYYEQQALACITIADLSKHNFDYVPHPDSLILPSYSVKTSVTNKEGVSSCTGACCRTLKLAKAKKVCTGMCIEARTTLCLDNLKNGERLHFELVEFNNVFRAFNSLHTEAELQSIAKLKKAWFLNKNFTYFKALYQKAKGLEDSVSVIGDSITNINERKANLETEIRVKEKARNKLYRKHRKQGWLSSKDWKNLKILKSNLVKHHRLVATYNRRIPKLTALKQNHKEVGADIFETATDTLQEFLKHAKNDDSKVLKWMFSNLWLTEGKLRLNPLYKYSQDNTTSSKNKEFKEKVRKQEIIVSALKKRILLFENAVKEDSKSKSCDVCNETLDVRYDSLLHQLSRAEYGLTSLKKKIKSEELDKLTNYMAWSREHLLQDYLLYKGFLAIGKSRNHNGSYMYELMSNEPIDEVVDGEYLSILVQNEKPGTKLLLDITEVKIIKDNYSFLDELVVREAIVNPKNMAFPIAAPSYAFQDYIKVYELIINYIERGFFAFPIKLEKDLTPMFETKPLYFPLPLQTPVKVSYVIKEQKDKDKKVQVNKETYAFRINRLYRFRPKIGMIYSGFTPQRVDLNDGSPIVTNSVHGLDISFGMQVFLFRNNIRDGAFMGDRNNWYTRFSIYAGSLLQKEPFDNYILGLAWEPWNGVAISGGFHLGRQERLISSGGEFASESFWVGNQKWHNHLYCGILLDTRVFTNLFNFNGFTNPFKKS